MTISNREISFYVDTLIVEAIVGDEKLYKQASTGGLVSSLIDKVKWYVGNQIDPNDKAGSLMNILGPGVIFNAFRAFGFGWMGALIGLAMRVFHIDVTGMFRSMWDKLGSLISGDRQVSSGQVDSIVQGVAQEHMSPITEEEATAAQQLLTKSNFDDLMRDARLIKLTMISYASDSLRKEAGFFDTMNHKKKKTTNILAKVFGWVLKIGLASAGLMVAGDVVNKFLDRPNALDGSVQKGKPVDPGPAKSAVPVMPYTTQTKFKVKPSYHIESNNTASAWIERSSNSHGSISTMLTNFAKSVYDGLDGKESIIQGTPGFQAILDRIVFFNRNAAGGSVVFIPPEFKSKKQITDAFIDDVAEKAV